MPREGRAEGKEQRLKWCSVCADEVDTGKMEKYKHKNTQIWWKSGTRPCTTDTQMWK